MTTALDGAGGPPDEQPGERPAEQAHHEQRGGRARRVGIRAAQVSVSIALIVVLFAVAIPRLAGGYGAVWEQLRLLTLGQVLVLASVWLFGLWVYARVYQRCLPGLRRSQSLVVNAAGASVSNVVPFGGAAGVGTTFGMTMSWGYAAPAVSATVLLSGLMNFFVALSLPVLALAILAIEGHATWQLATPAATGTLIIAGGIVFLTLVERSEPAAERVGDALQRIGSAVLRVAHVHREIHWKRALLEFRHQTSQILRTEWFRLASTVVAYKLSQFVLLLLAVQAVDPSTTLGWADIFAAFAFGRALSAVPVTPGGVGIVEAGSIAALAALGEDPAAAAAAVLLFSGFVYLLEIPLGGAAWLVWLTKRDWRRERAG